MKLSVWLHRENEQVPAVRVVRDDRLVNIGIEHEETRRLFSIGVHPDGTITCVWCDERTGTFGSVHELGRINDDGTFDIHEPRPLT